MNRTGIIRLLLISCTLALQLVFLLILTPGYQAASGGLPFFDTSPIWDAQTILDITSRLSPEAAAIYDTMQIVDLLFPVFYTAALISWVPAGRRRSAAVLLLVSSGGVFDLAENLIIHRLLHRMSSLPGLLPYITVTKFALIGIAIVLIIHLHRSSSSRSVTKRQS